MKGIIFFLLVFTFSLSFGVEPKRDASDKCYNLLKKLEKLELKAYQDLKGVWTIGYGITHYEDGRKVKKGDTITEKRANDLLKFHVNKVVCAVDGACSKVHLKQQQFDALVSFTYNVGENNFKSSTLLKKVNANPNDPAIRVEFMKWVYSGHKFSEGLKNRRKKEVNLYFS